MNERSKKVTVIRSDRRERVDAVAIEDPLEIRIGEESLAVTMRTPGDDTDLVRGFLLTEGILVDPSEIVSMQRLDESRMTVMLREDIHLDMDQFKRNMFVSSSCGVCGKASIEQVQLLARPAPAYTISRSVVSSLTTQLREAQPTFDTTGGLHAAGLYDLDGQALSVREDVGRHNAVDKVIGNVARMQWPLPPVALVVSGRQSFEIMQKAALVGIGVVVGVSAPSSLAVSLAQDTGMLLVGFSRGAAYNVYAGADRLTD